MTYRLYDDQATFNLVDLGLDKYVDGLIQHRFETNTYISNVGNVASDRVNVDGGTAGFRAAIVSKPSVEFTGSFSFVSTHETVVGDNHTILYTPGNLSDFTLLIDSGFGNVLYPKTSSITQNELYLNYVIKLIIDKDTH